MLHVPQLVWTALAVGQSLVWFFALPPLFKPYWEGLWGGLAPLTQQLVLNQLVVLYFIAAAILMIPIYAGNMPFFEQFKISSKVWAWRSAKKQERDDFWALTRRSLTLFAINVCCIVPVLTALKYFIMSKFTADMSFTTDDWPSYPTLFAHNVALTLVHEFGFYWCHRLAHHPNLYTYHKVHHDYQQNTILASQHEHPIDYIVTIATPALLALAIINPHSFTLFHWMAWLIVANIDDHVGYAFPWSPVRWFWFAASTDQHEFHHSKNMGCFASKLGVFDWWFESERPYLAWRAKRERGDTAWKPK